MTPKRIVETRELKVTQGSDRGLLGWKVIEAFQAIAARYTTRNRHPGFGYQVCIPYLSFHRPGLAFQEIVRKTDLLGRAPLGSWWKSRFSGVRRPSTESAEAISSRPHLSGQSGCGAMRVPIRAEKHAPEDRRWRSTITRSRRRLVI